MGGSGLAYSGAVYNHWLHKLTNLSVAQLQAILDNWNKRPWYSKLGGYLNPVVGWEAKLRAVQAFLARYSCKSAR